MHSFKDTTGQQWDINLVRSTLSLIKARTGIDLLSIYEVDANGNLSRLEEVLGDEEKLIKVLAVACDTQIIERKITPVQFGDLLKADQLEEAAEALAREGASFFPMARRSAIISVLDTAKIVAQRLFATLPENLNVQDVAEQILKQLLAESLDSTKKTTANPAPEPSTNSAGGSQAGSAETSTLTDIAFQNSADFTPPPTDSAGTTQPRL